MKAENFDVAALLRMAHSPIRNYVIPGLTSSLIGGVSKYGAVRLFQNSRDHQDTITPHSHRYDFMCWVLRGTVRNRLWSRSYATDPNGDEYRTTTLRYGGDVGKYVSEPGQVNRWRYRDQTFDEGQCYSMTANEVHSIFFSRGAVVLFFEGPSTAETSIVIEPVVDGETINTLEVKPWMFKRDP